MIFICNPLNIFTLLLTGACCPSLRSIACILIVILLASLCFFNGILIVFSFISSGILYRGYASGTSQGTRVVHTTLVNKMEQKAFEISLSLGIRIPNSFNSSSSFLQNTTIATFNNLLTTGPLFGYPTNTKFSDYVLIYFSPNSYFFFSNPNGETDSAESTNFFWVGKWNNVTFSTSPYQNLMESIESTFIGGQDFVKIQSLGSGSHKWFADSSKQTPISFQNQNLLPFSVNEQLSFAEDSGQVMYTCTFFMNTQHFAEISQELAEYSSTEYLFHSTLHYPSMKVLGSSVPHLWNSKFQDVLSKISSSLKESDLLSYENQNVFWEDLPLPLIASTTFDYFLVSITPQFFISDAKNLKLIHVWGYSMLSVFLQTMLAIVVTLGATIFIFCLFSCFFVAYSCVTIGFFIQLFVAVKRINKGDFLGGKKALLFPWPLFTEFYDIRQNWLRLVDNLLVAAPFVISSSTTVRNESKKALALHSDRNTQKTTQFYFSLPIMGYLSQETTNNPPFDHFEGGMRVYDLKLNTNSYKIQYASILTLQIGGIADFMERFSQQDWMIIQARITQEVSAIARRRGGEVAYFNADRFQLVFLNQESNPIGALNAIFTAFEIVKCFEYINICGYERGNTDCFFSAQIGIATSYVGISRLGIEGIKVKECSVFGKRAFFSRSLSEINEDMGTEVLIDSVTAKILQAFNKQSLHSQKGNVYPDFEDRFPFGSFTHHDVFWREETEKLSVVFKIPKFSGIFRFRQIGVLHISDNRSKKNLESFFQVSEFSNFGANDTTLLETPVSGEEMHYDQGFAAYMEGNYEKAEEFLLPETIKRSRIMKSQKKSDHNKAEETEEKSDREDEEDEEEFEDDMVENIINAIKKVREKHKGSDGELEELDPKTKGKLFQVFYVDEKLYREDKVVEL